MSEFQDFLVEIQTEELPPKMLRGLSIAFEKYLVHGLHGAHLIFEESRCFAAPRRLAVYVKKLSAHQPNQTQERKGPAVQAAYDDKGKPLPAAVGFAKSCGVEIDDLTTIKTDKGEWLYYKKQIPGKQTPDLLLDIVKRALDQLPIKRRMRWGSHQESFVRPVHSVVMMFDSKVIEGRLFDITIDEITYGHRFLSRGHIALRSPAAYEEQLENEGFVIVDFEKRKALIRDQIESLLREKWEGEFKAVVDEDLLDEVTSLVEWPVAMVGEFDKKFLKVPKECLVSAMQDHQKSFPVVDDKQALQPYFIFISNIVSEKPEEVVKGNEYVMRARLSDAAFFYEMDCKAPLVECVEKLRSITDQEKLGSLYDKTKRLQAIAKNIAPLVNANKKNAERAAFLCKADLVTDMVGEFPELQGIMGSYLAKRDGEDDAVAEAIREHYLPRFSGDILPESDEGLALTLADRLDTLVGLYALHGAPTGDKDPFGLRRAALGVIRVLIEKSLSLRLSELITIAMAVFPEKLIKPSLGDEIKSFCIDRFRSYAFDQAMTPDVFTAVEHLGIDAPFSAFMRMQAVKHFKTLPEAQALAAANKRVSNILVKQASDFKESHIDKKLFETDIEKALASAIAEKEKSIQPLLSDGDYQEALISLATLRSDVDAFFDQVMVMVEDDKVRKNRLGLLLQLRQLFLQVADIAYLQ
ncbi:MAG: glycine--tRNA ligase subunit beta [Gammaproteobacteria bacterium]